MVELRRDKEGYIQLYYAGKYIGLFNNDCEISIEKDSVFITKENITLFCICKKMVKGCN